MITTLKLTNPQKAAVMSALEQFLENDPEDSDAEEVLKMLEER